MCVSENWHPTPLVHPLPIVVALMMGWVMVYNPINFFNSYKTLRIFKQWGLKSWRTNTLLFLEVRGTGPPWSPIPSLVVPMHQMNTCIFYKHCRCRSSVV